MTVMMHGMNPPSQQKSADGCWFIAVNHPKGGRFQVFREYPDGRSEELPETRLRLIGGQGKLELMGDGTLWASFGLTAGSSPVDRFPITAFVPYAPRMGVPVPMGPMLDLAGMWQSLLTPAHEHDGLMYSRWNNLREMLKRNAR